MVDVTNLKSHPDKVLFDHIEGVIGNVKKLTDSKFAELIAIFHDLGKINPNFQKKISGQSINGYSHHSYLSAYAFFCAFGLIKDNSILLKKWLGKEKYTKNDLIALITLIAKHHGDIPDFLPKDDTGTGASILNKEENEKLFEFLKNNDCLQVEEYTKHFFKDIKPFNQCLLNKNVQNGYKNQLIFQSATNSNPLDFYLETQFSFASLVQADKVDAAKFENFIDRNKTNVKVFCNSYSQKLENHIKSLKQDSDLNKLRTIIRIDAVEKIKTGLKGNNRVFELTAPTGSGKTLMLLSLASEIINFKGAKRIIYSLPFLSITEQVEAEVLKIFDTEKEYIQRIDSKSQNKTFEQLQVELDSNPSKEISKKINLVEFQENTFSYPFVITTFVRFFETLLSNKNADLLKLPNFSRSIFLLDEIQALPPRLYSFFIAYLSRFCELNDSYAIISTATQPNFSLPNKQEIIDFFPNYKKPLQLLSLNYFQNELFNRYKINYANEATDMEELSQKLINTDKSTLVILNTIDDTKDLYSLLIGSKLAKDEVLLLNTHLTPRHRKIKIYCAKRRLRQNKKIILISTQLIEAGVDIDFPVLYRDMATVSSIVQSAGRCNRNGKIENGGIVNLIKLKKDGRYRANLIYRGQDKDLLTFTTQILVSKNYEEKQLIDVQKKFFNKIKDELYFAKHSQKKPALEFDFLNDIKEASFNKIGKFRLIDENIFGEELEYYVPKNENDDSFELLNSYIEDLKTEIKNVPINWGKIKNLKNRIKIQRKKMAENIVRVRLKNNHIKPVPTNQTESGDLFELAVGSYSFDKGIDLEGDDNIF